LTFAWVPKPLELEPAGVGHFLRAGNSNVEIEIFSPQTGISSGPRRGLAAIVLAYYLQSGVRAKTRSGLHPVKLQGGECVDAPDAG
jgi:hypothetical protein